MSPKLLNLARTLAGKCSLPSPTSIDQISVPFLSSLYRRVCHSKLEDPPILPDLSTQPKEHLTAIFDVLSCNFLNLDLDSILGVEDIIRRDEAALVFLLRVFDDLFDCVEEPQQSKEAPSTKISASRKIPGPTYKGRRVLNTRSSSVLYSPRIAALRLLKRSKSTLVNKLAASKVDRSIDGSAIRKSAEEPSVLNHARGIQRRQRKAAERREMNLAIEAAKASIRNREADLRRRTAVLQTTASRLILLKASNELKLENAKEKANFSGTTTSSANLALASSGMAHSTARKAIRSQNAEIRSLLSNLLR